MNEHTGRFHLNATVITAVRDATRFGGGIAGAAVPIHLGLYIRNAGALLVSGTPVSEVVPGQHCLSPSGVGFATLHAEKLSTVVLHVHGLWGPFELRACKYARRLRIPLIMSPHGMLEPWALQHKKAKKWLAWRLYQRRWLSKADLLIVNSWKEYRTVREMGLKAPVAMIENGVDTSGFDSNIIRTDDRKCVLFLSRLSPVKGIFDLLEAWARLPSSHSYELRIYGHADPGYDLQVNAIIKRLGLEKSVKVHGAVFGSEKWQVYKNADVFVLPSYSENFGIVIAESLLAGLPVITTRATPWEFLESENLGWLVENDVEQLTEALLKAISLPEPQRQAMGKTAEAYAKERFLWPDIIDKYAETYDWVAGVRSGRPAWVREE